MFTIPSGLITIYQDYADSLIEFGNIGRVHKLIYPPNLENCPNCIVNTMGGVSTNVYKTGGPIPFTMGVCPFCGGQGFKEIESSENVKINILRNPKQFVNLGIQVDVTDGMIQIRAYITDISKLMRAKYLQLDSNHSEYGSFLYTRSSDMVPIGIGGPKYCMGFWRRA